MLATRWSTTGREPIATADGMKDVHGAMEGRRRDESWSPLVECAQGGDVVAYEALVRRFQELAFRVAYVLTGSAVEVEDATQDAIAKTVRPVD